MNAKLTIATLVVISVAIGLYFYSPEAHAPTPETTDLTETATSSDTGTTTNSTTTSATDTSNTHTKKTTAPTQATYNEPPQESRESEMIDLPYNKIITYDGKRFVPEEVTIVEGGTVRFVNLSEEEEMWVASNNHPTHTLYPIDSDDSCSGNTFDQCKSVTLGGSWSFTFERFGDWSFHNHVRAKDTGTVHVLRAEEYVER